MRSVLLGLCGLACLAFIGCADPAAEKAQDDLVRKTLAMMNESSDHMDEIVRDPSPENYKKRQAALLVLANQIETNGKAIEKLAGSAQDRIDRKFKKDLEQAEARMKKSGARFDRLTR